MWLCFVPAEYPADPLLVFACHQDVCDCVLSLLDILLILCWSLLATRKYVIGFVPAGYPADPLLVFACHQIVCDCVLCLLNILLILYWSLFTISGYVIVL